MILKGYIEEGETMFDAIARVAVLAGQNGFKGYAICCRECGEKYEAGSSCRCTRQLEKKYNKWAKEHNEIKGGGKKLAQDLR